MHLLYAKTDGAITANVKEKQGNNNDNKGAVNRYIYALAFKWQLQPLRVPGHQLYYVFQGEINAGDKGAPRKTVCMELKVKRKKDDAK